MNTELHKLADCKVELVLMPYQVEVLKSLIRSEMMTLEYDLRCKGTIFTKEERSKMIIEYHQVYNMLEDATKR